MNNSAEKVETLAGLTLKQEAFAKIWARTRNSSVAYRQSYDCDEASPETIHVNACKVRHNAKVATRILELLEKQADHADLTDEWILDALMVEAKEADGDGARATNLKTLAQTRAMLVQRTLTEDDRTDEENIMAIITADGSYKTDPKGKEELTKPDQELYDQLAGKLGV